MAEPIRIIAPSGPDDPVIIADVNLDSAEYGRITVPRDQWRIFITRAKTGEFDF